MGVFLRYGFEGLIFGILRYYDHFEAGEMHT